MLSGADTATLDDEAGEKAVEQNNGQLVLSLSWKAAR